MKTLILLILPFALLAQSIEIKREIPIQIKNGIPIVYASVKGLKRAFILDTGASSSIIDSKYIKPLKLRHKKSFNTNISGIGGSSEVYYIDSLPIMDLEGNILHSRFIGSDMGSVSKTMNVLGVLGGDFLSDGWFVDYQNSRLININYLSNLAAID